VCILYMHLVKEDVVRIDNRKKREEGMLIL
jgi:hypothetical protein